MSTKSTEYLSLLCSPNIIIIIIKKKCFPVLLDCKSKTFIVLRKTAM